MMTKKPDSRPYIMRISRQTIDKLGVKLYDTVSAVVAEIIANSYDADAEKVTVRLPLATLLARKNDKGEVEGYGYVIEIADDGHGMTPTEAIDHYLEVGRNRRDHPEQGNASREKGRPVMGRKGIGKLAPFGICQTIEVYSAGGEKTKEGYLVTHFFMDFEKILSESEDDQVFDAGDHDRTFSGSRGTTIRLSGFLPKRVPDEETFHRQLAARFVFARPDFEVIVEDTRDPEAHPPTGVSPISISLMDGTKIDLSSRPVLTDDGEELSVTGWLGLASQAYKYEETAGVRIYARGKIVATTRDFEQPAGFTGEFTMRSYLVGEVNAEWLDIDEGDDLIRTDRQSILWDSEYGRALRKWGAELIREIGAASRKPRRKRKSDIFLEASDFEKHANERFADQEVVDVAIDLAKQIGGFAAEDELTDQDYVSDLSEVILSVAPHKALISAFQDFGGQVLGGDVTLDTLLDLFGKTRIAEIASYGQLATERVKAIDELEKIVIESDDEDKLQQLIARAPWLIEPSWTVITKNQALKTFKTSFENYWKDKSGEDLSLAIGFETKRPDFTVISIGHMLHIVEIKKPGHSFNDEDFERLINYVYAFDEFFAENDRLKDEFPRGWRIDLVADSASINKLANRTSYESFESDNKVKRMNWNDFLLRAKKAHEEFLEIRDKAAEQVSEMEDAD